MLHVFFCMKYVIFYASLGDFYARLFLQY